MIISLKLSLCHLAIVSFASPIPVAAQIKSSIPNNDAPKANYQVSLKCAAMAKALKDNRLMIGGQDFAAINAKAYSHAIDLAKSESRLESDVAKDFQDELQKINKPRSPENNKIKVVSSDSTQNKAPNFGNSFAYLDVMSEFRHNMPCIFFFGNNNE